jgi:hypothetical protein
MAEPEQPKRPRLNADRRRALMAARLRQFLQQYERQAQKGVEPNDRHYDREFEKAVKRMKPDEIDRLARDDEE